MAALVLLLLGCGDEGAPYEERNLPSPEEVRVDLEGRAFDDFIEQSYRRLLARNAELVHYEVLDDEIDVGQTLLADISEAFTAETFAIEQIILELLLAHDRGALTADQQLTYDAYEWWLDDRVRGQPVRELEYLVGPFGSEAIYTAGFIVGHLYATGDVDAYIDRLWRIEEKLAQLEELLLRRAERGIIPPDRAIAYDLAWLEANLADAPRDSYLYKSALDFQPYDDVGGGEMEESEQLARCADAIKSSVFPAYRSLRDTLEDLRRSAPPGDAVSRLPNGDAFYQHALRHHTTLEMTADEIHELGLSELTRIRAEMEERFLALGYEGGRPLREQIERVAQADGGPVPETEVESTHKSIVREAERRLLGQVIDVAPDAQLDVRAIAGGGYYVGPRLGRPQSATFWAPLRNEGRFEMRSLAYHEAVPGHHLQVGVALKLDLPLARRDMRFTAHGEGWGLYAEWLAADLGWYEGDPYGDIGRLRWEALRAARLVVDTGIHTRGWTYEEGVTYLEENVGSSRACAEEEVFRYIVWPGQASAYLVGYLRLRALRGEAETALGEEFDLVKFHRAVLLDGALPLDLLGKNVRARLGI